MSIKQEVVSNEHEKLVLRRSNFKALIFGSKNSFKLELVLKYSRVHSNENSVRRSASFTELIVKVKNETIFLSVWDTPACTKNIIPSYFVSADAIIICANVLEIESISCYFELSKKEAPDVPIFIAITSKEQNPSLTEEQLCNLKQKYETPIFVISITSDIGMDDLFQKIATDLIEKNLIPLSSIRVPSIESDLEFDNQKHCSIF